MSPFRVQTLLLLLCVLVLASSCGWSLWDSPMTTVRPRSDFGKSIDQIFMLISWTTLAIFLAVEGLLLYCCWRFRERPGAQLPRPVHGHTPLELSWTVAFAVVLLIIGIPTIQIIFRTQAAPAASDLIVDVAGHQWWWEFKYPAYNVTTAGELHLPLGRTVAFRLHAPDVIHSFWIPGLGGKRDVVPHRVNQLVMTPEKPGEYRGQCAEYCGTSHANMRFRVIVESNQEFERWVKGQQAPPVESTDPLAQQGKDIFGKSPCVGCHTIAGVSAGQIGPNLTHFASRHTFAGSTMETKPKEFADWLQNPALPAPDLVKWIENPAHMKPGALMPNLGMTPDQSKALAAYVLTLK